ncbi:MAG: DUF805 domain-containing protein [Gammaproteobacteria bacterium]|nr:MAG: DUF805 domain-containing protein [Gammaproteobacteria bacterium]
MEATNPYESPKSNPATSSDQTYQPKFLALNGRIGRLRYLAYGMIATVLTIVVLGILSAIMIPMLASSGMSEAIMVVILVVLYLPLIVFSIIFMKRRLNDLDKSGWWQLLVYIPIVGIIFALYILFWPGTKGSNSYGMQPSSNSGLLIIAGLILPIVLVGILAAIAIPAYQDYVERAQQVIESQN